MTRKIEEFKRLTSINIDTRIKTYCLLNKIPIGKFINKCALFFIDSELRNNELANFIKRKLEFQTELLNFNEKIEECKKKIDLLNEKRKNINLHLDKQQKKLEEELATLNKQKTNNFQELEQKEKELEERWKNGDSKLFEDWSELASQTNTLKEFLDAGKNEIDIYYYPLRVNGKVTDPWLKFWSQHPEYLKKITNL